MSSMIPGKAVRNAIYGLKVDRAAGNLAQTGNLVLFTVTGGRVILTGFVGEVTTVIQSQANAVKFNTLGTVGSLSTDLCATVETNALAVGNLIGFAGGASNAAVVGSNVLQPNETIIQPGSIRMNAAASNTGQMKFTLTYIPLDDGATVTAA
jgi:hypothetical protein